MSEVGRVIPYADAVRPRGGMRLGTMLTLYAIAAAGMDLADSRDLARMLAMITQRTTPSAGMIALEWLFLAATVCMLIAAGLLLFRRPVGAMVMAGVNVARVTVLVPMLLAILYSPERFRGAPLDRVAENAAGSLLTWIGSGVWVWFFCRLAIETRREYRREEVSWSAVHRGCAWGMLLFGVCHGLAQAIPAVRAAITPRMVWWPWGLPTMVAAGLLALSGAGAVFRKRWAWRMCIVAVAAWALHTWAGSVVGQMRDSGFWTMLRSIDLKWVLNALNPVPMAMLWILVLYHPAVRGRWTVVEVQE